METRDIWKKSWIPPKAVIGIDQSYTRTGISIAINGKLKVVSYIDFKGLHRKTEKRREVYRVVEKYAKKLLTKYRSDEIIVVCERIRTFSSNITESITYDKPIISTSFIKATGALISTIVDAVFDYGIKVYSVDTRAWKTAILGTSKPDMNPLDVKMNPQKIRAVRYVIEKGFGDSITLYSGKAKIKSYCDDAADSACIALYPYVDIKKLSLSLEE